MGKRTIIINKEQVQKIFEELQGKPSLESSQKYKIGHKSIDATDYAHIPESSIEEKKDKPYLGSKKVNAGIMDAIAGGDMVCENTEWNDKFNYKPYIKSILEFLEKEGLQVKPYPSFLLKKEEQDGLFIRTGYYDPTQKKVVAFIKDRHPKDVLRSITHELVHHYQNLNGTIENNGYSGQNVKDDSELEKLESEAYLKGNILFRKWTETVCPDIYNNIQKINENPQYFTEDYFRNIANQVEGGDLDEDLNPEDVDLSSFEVQDELCPKFWKNKHLDSRIRLRLLDIADDFIESLDVDWVEPEDIIMTGSLANYNWNKEYSDIDLHIVMDFSKVDERIDFVKEYFDSKKKLWNEEHKDLKIFGFPVEVYVQDANEKHSSSGVYSLEKNE